MQKLQAPIRALACSQTHSTTSAISAGSSMTRDLVLLQPIVPRFFSTTARMWEVEQCPEQLPGKLAIPGQAPVLSQAPLIPV